MSMVLGGMWGTDALDPRSTAHSERRRRLDRTNARREWNRAVSATLAVAHAGMASCCGANLSEKYRELDPVRRGRRGVQRRKV